MPKSSKRRFAAKSSSRKVSGDPRKQPSPQAGERAALASALLSKAVAAPLADPLGFAALPALVLHAARAARPEEFPVADCVHACLTLARAYAEAGITAQVRTAELTVTDAKTGAEAVHGVPRPHWAEGRFFGHTVLWLPASRHLIDPSAERYAEIAAWKAGPVIAAAGPAPASAGPGASGSASSGSASENGAISVAVTRGYLHLAYTLGSAAASASVLDDPAVKDGLDDDHARGLNIAAEVIRLLATERTPAETAAIPYPRAVTLINAAR